MSYFRVYILLFLVFISVNGHSEATKKNQVEDIFIWKISDELQLSAKEEKAFGDIHRSLNKKKSELNEQIKILQIDIKQKKTKLSALEQEKLIKKNKNLLLQLNQVNIEEFDSTKKILGAEKFLEYLFLKQELNSKFKSMILGGALPATVVSGDKSKNLDTKPVVIEEK